jgi:hypothetical protein
MGSVESEIKEKFFEELYKQNVDNADARDKGIHISNASYGCPRKLYFDITTPKRESKEEFSKDRKGLYRMWIGTKLHETPFTDNHEYKMKYSYRGMDITGTIDEIFVDSEGKKWIIDKKFVGYAPNFVMQPHHRDQVGYYSWLYKQLTGENVAGVVLFYFIVKESYLRNKKVSEDDVPEDTVIRVFKEELTPEDIDNFGKQLLYLVDPVIDGYLTFKVPEKNVSWYCEYCLFREVCFAGKSLSDIKKEIG